ncbi:TPR-like protein [Favolaschia claudopus]|uniref:TPR-like protein n=1 Tax=Favolaschia claudopus TaxID=2862362 RepID=A0AAW0BD97_9AGAR
MAKRPSLTSLFTAPILGLSPILNETRTIHSFASRTLSLLVKCLSAPSEEVDGALSSTDSRLPRLPPYLALQIRKEELASLVNELSNPARSCLACTGGYGMGKSTMGLLAMHHKPVTALFHRRRWINCYTFTDTSSFLQTLATEMGVAFHMTECKADAWKMLDAIVASLNDRHSRGPDRRTFLVLDDLDHLYSINKALANAVIEALASVQGLTLLLTVNGWPIAAPDVVDWTLHLNPLSPEMAEYLFQTVYAVPRQRKELRELLKLVGGVPQYIVILANLAYERRLQPSDLLQLLEDPETNLLGAYVDGGRSLEASMRAYTPEERLGHDPHALRVFHILASHPGGIQRERLQSYVGLSPETLDSICNQLSRLSFIQDENPSRLMLTRPVREYALRFSEVDDETRQVLLSQIISLAEIPKGRLRPGAPEFLQTCRLFEEERTNLENILYSFLNKEHMPVAVEATLQYLQPLCAVRPSLKLATRAVELAEKLSPPNPSLLAQALRTLAEITYNNGLFEADRIFARAEILFRDMQDEPSVIGALECRFFLSEIRHRSGLMDRATDGLIYAEGFEEAVQRASTLSSDAGKRCHAMGLMKIAPYTEDESRGKEFLHTARDIFDGLNDEYGKTLCAMKLGVNTLQLVNLAQKFEEFGDLDMAARCYSAIAPSYIEYCKVEGFREMLLVRGMGDDAILNLLTKAIDIYELLGRKLDVAFSQYHLAQLLPPAQAVSLYSRAIYQFNISRFTHHRERGTLDMCYSLVEERSYAEAVAYLEVLQDEIGYCGHIFVVRCRELLTECHCRLNAQRPAAQAATATLEAVRQLGSDRSSEIELLTPRYTNLLAALEGQTDLLPAVQYETHVGERSRFIEMDSSDDSEDSDDSEEEES